MASLRKRDGGTPAQMTVRQWCWHMTNDERYLESSQVHGWIKSGTMPADCWENDAEGRKVINVAAAEKWFATRPSRRVSETSLTNRYIKLYRSVQRSRVIAENLPATEAKLERVTAELNAIGVDVDSIDTRTDKQRDEAA